MQEEERGSWDQPAHPLFGGSSASGPHERKVGSSHHESTSSAVSRSGVSLLGLKLRAVLPHHGPCRAESLPLHPSHKEDLSGQAVVFLQLRWMQQ